MPTAIADAEPTPPELAAAPTPAIVRRAFAQVEVLADFGSARAAWDEICARGAIASPYQSIEFARAWSETVGASRGVTPMIVVARDGAGVAVALLPLGRFRRGPLRFASFLGGRTANYHMGLFLDDFAWRLTEIEALLRTAATQARPRIDCFVLINQPMSWRGVENPLAALARQPSPSFAYASALPGSFEVWRDAHYSKSAQKKLRNKAKRLQCLGPLNYRRALDAREARMLLDAFFVQKRARMRELKLPAEFEDEPTIALLRRLTAFAGIGKPAPALELHGLRAGARIVAVFGGFAFNGRLSGAFISYDLDPSVAASSPGELLIQEIVRDAIDRGLTGFDLGVGEARYKSECCETTEILFDSAFAVSTIGRLSATAFLVGRRIKRRVKQSPRLYAMALSAQRFLT